MSTYARWNSSLFSLYYALKFASISPLSSHLISSTVFLLSFFTPLRRKAGHTVTHFSNFAVAHPIFDQYLTHWPPPTTTKKKRKKKKANAPHQHGHNNSRWEPWAPPISRAKIRRRKFPDPSGGRGFHTGDRHNTKKTVGPLRKGRPPPLRG